MPFEIVMVCTGNICRSPLAEQLLRAQLADAGVTDITLSSAGLHAVVDAPMDTIPAEISRRLGGSPDPHRGRMLRTAISENADLLLTMTRDQRNELVQRYPRAMRRTFTLVEYSRLLGLLPLPDGATGADALREHTAQLAQIRSRVALTAADEIADPYLANRQVHEAIGSQIALATSHVAHALASNSVSRTQ